MEHRHICQWCEKKFITQSKRDKFCSPSCASKFSNRKRAKIKKEQNKELFEQISKRKLPQKEQINHFKFFINGIYTHSINDFTYHKDKIEICQQCGKKFIETRNDAKFCSNECLIESRKIKIKQICINCQKEFLVTQIDKKYDIFCSTQCEQNFYKHLNKHNLTLHEKEKSYCINCNKEFYPIEPRNSILFCSHNCEREFEIKKHLKEKTCLECGKIFTTKNSKFCSKHCASSYTAKNIGLGKEITHKTNGMKNKKHNSISRSKMSKNISQAIKNGKMNGNPLGNYLSGYVNFIPHNFRSGWEFNFAIILLHLKRDYRYESKTFKLKDGKRYTPDFYDVKRNIFYEIKGRNNSLQKCEILQKERPNIKIHFIDYKKYIRIYNYFAKKLKLVYSVTGGEKGFYSVDDVKKLLISKEEHDKLFINNRYKKWDKKFDKRNNI